MCSASQLLIMTKADALRALTATRRLLDALLAESLAPVDAAEMEAAE